MCPDSFQMVIYIFSYLIQKWYRMDVFGSLTRIKIQKAFIRLQHELSSRWNSPDETEAVRGAQVFCGISRYCKVEQVQKYQVLIRILEYIRLIYLICPHLQLNISSWFITLYRNGRIWCFFVGHCCWVFFRDIQPNIDSLQQQGSTISRRVS